ncbi:Uncharacterised protein [Enterobacter hormaechei]|uniref:hypothetical protein n=1 Tax=Enterobacteriaceae TaxID=543 RepID=UPI0012597E18|nr:MULTISPECIES: hypothetical protein [Enterobacteriaceae]MCE9984165.1 hypothetical protein [Leclercia adecarboxylata]VAE21556.1 Uncharacterised protein [Enterobacter hormaechei]VAE27064.1 Uncharacterised protein [Enterobacter hormaechei]
MTTGLSRPPVNKKQWMKALLIPSLGDMFFVATLILVVVMLQPENMWVLIALCLLALGVSVNLFRKALNRLKLEKGV